jgi:hypothetical protein
MLRHPAGGDVGDGASSTAPAWNGGSFWFFRNFTLLSGHTRCVHGRAVLLAFGGQRLVILRHLSAGLMSLGFPREQPNLALWREAPSLTKVADCEAGRTAEGTPGARAIRLDCVATARLQERIPGKRHPRMPTGSRLCVPTDPLVAQLRRGGTGSGSCSAMLRRAWRPHLDADPVRRASDRIGSHIAPAMGDGSRPGRAATSRHCHGGRRGEMAAARAARGAAVTAVRG